METRHAGIPVARKVSSVKGDGIYDSESNQGGTGGFTWNSLPSELPLYGV